MTLDFIRALAWPTFAVLALLLILAFLGRRVPQSRTPEQPMENRLLTPADPAKLAQSLQDADWLATLEAHPAPDPVVHLQQAIQVHPSTFRESTQKIREQFRVGRVIILDLADTEEEMAVRLVDFCSAMTLASHGVLYRLSSSVLLITPPAGQRAQKRPQA